MQLKGHRENENREEEVGCVSACECVLERDSDAASSIR